MNYEAISVFFVFFIIWFLIRHMYIHAVMPFMNDFFRFKLFELRDDLRRMEYENKPSSDFSYRFMESVFNRSTKAVGRISIASLVLHKPNLESRKRLNADLKRFDEEAPFALKKLDARYIKIMLLSAATQSPFIVVIASIIKVFSPAPIHKFKKDSRTTLHCH